MPARILHVSDLHLGRRETPEVGDAVRELAARLEPELVVATGDLAHRGRRAELERAAAFLRGLGRPLLAVPGNHDIPYTLPARAWWPFAEWQRVFGETAPVYRSETLVVCGLNSVRPWRHQDGALRASEVAAAAAVLREAPPGALRVVAFHHHVASAPWRTRKPPVADRDAVLRALADAGAELVLSGHVHQAGAAERREFEVLEGPARGLLVLATVAGLGRPRPRRRGEARGVNVYEADAGSLTATTYAWDGAGLVELARRSFPRG
ncbi:MAG TPA: metallophosphoesterase [Gaiellaceae bacterium]|nr:metallophosphoesterase [Gaiellaceae bacterium]